MAKDPHEEAQKLYEQILDLLEEVVQLYASVDSSEDADEDIINDSDIIDLVMEEAVERGLDEISVHHVFKAVSALGRKAQEA